jgi:hypothetical protein
METIWISSRGDRTSYFSGASDYGYVNPSWDGIKRAVDEFCPRVAKRPVIFGDKSGTAMVRRSVNPKAR